MVRVPKTPQGLRPAMLYSDVASTGENPQFSPCCATRKGIRAGAGRKPLECRVRMDDALRMEKQGTDKKIAEQMGVSLATYYRKRKNYLEGLCQGN